MHGDSFRAEGQAERLAWANAHLGKLVTQTAKRNTAAYAPGFPDRDPAEVASDIKMATFRTTVFATGLTAGDIKKRKLVRHFARATSGLYIPNDSIDGGGRQADVTIQAIGLALGGHEAPEGSAPELAARLKALSHVEKSIRKFARDEDVRPLLKFSQGQVWTYEMAVQLLSREFVAMSEKDREDFLETCGPAFADFTALSSGFRCISAGLYALRRQESGQHPPLDEVYDCPDIRRMEDINSVISRIWDDQGDTLDDGIGINGDGPVPNTFVLNSYNQYHPSIIRRYCELAEIPSEKEEVLHDAIGNYHNDMPRHGARVIETLRAHIKGFVRGLPPDVHRTFGEYINWSKRVDEIALVNAMGDRALRERIDTGA